MYFRGEFHYLSNMAEYGFYVNGRYYPTSEHFFQSCKCKHKEDFEWIMNSKSPVEAKKIAKNIEPRDNWDDIKVRVMKKGVYQKFKQNPEIADKLKQINEPIVEENWWHDTFWGVCNSKGKNALGQILLNVKMLLLLEDYMENNNIEIGG